MGGLGIALLCSLQKEERLHKGFKLYAKKNRKSFRITLPNFRLIAIYLAPGWQWVRKDKGQKRGRGSFEKGDSSDKRSSHL